MKKSNFNKLSCGLLFLHSETPKYSLVLERLACYRGTIIGRLYNLDDTLSLYTIENSEKRFETGEYKGFLSYSPKFSKRAFYKQLGGLVPEIKVSGRKGIRIHVANFKADVEGCVGVGLTANCMGVLDSRLAYKKLMELFDNGHVQDFVLHVIDRYLLNLDGSYKKLEYDDF